MARSRKVRRFSDESKSVTRPKVGTYQTRISDYADMDRLEGDAALAAYAELYGLVERKLFAEVAAGRSPGSLKSVYLQSRIVQVGEWVS